ncbi:MAG TPA: DUF3341 domain-containing protein [Candidatus Binataceae bacterium]|nr:DUF3341 domain-containing protein [Candidatus Binataceae bacterium]
MSAEIELVGTFAGEEECIHAVEALKRNGVAFRVFSPIPSEHLVHAIGHGTSPVRAFVLIGGIAGVLAGIAVTVGTSWEWNLIVGGKPVVSWPPFIIIMFELMILLGGLSAAASFFLFARLPQFDPIPGYSERFSADRFGIAVECDEADSAKIEAMMREAGAEEIAHEDPRPEPAEH